MLVFFSSLFYFTIEEERQIEKAMDLIFFVLFVVAVVVVVVSWLQCDPSLIFNRRLLTVLNVIQMIMMLMRRSEREREK